VRPALRPTLSPGSSLGEADIRSDAGDQCSSEDESGRDRSESDLGDIGDSSSEKRSRSLSESSTDSASISRTGVSNPLFLYVIYLTHSYNLYTHTQTHTHTHTNPTPTHAGASSPAPGGGRFSKRLQEEEVIMSSAEVRGREEGQ
jgi:hypothetical protein